MSRVLARQAFLILQRPAAHRLAAGRRLAATGHPVFSKKMSRTHRGRCLIVWFHFGKTLDWPDRQLLPLSPGSPELP